MCRCNISDSVTLSEDEDGQFSISRETGELRLMKGLKDRLITPVVHLQVMVRFLSPGNWQFVKDSPSPTSLFRGFQFCVQAYQDDDPRKYSVATVMVRVLAVNQFHPEFELPEYCGFVTAGKSPASLVNTYGSRALILNVQDQDFDNVSSKACPQCFVNVLVFLKHFHILL